MENSPSSVSGESRSADADIAATNEVRFAVKTVRGNRFVDRENWRQRFVLDDRPCSAAARQMLLRFADDERDDLAVIKHFLVREQNFVMTNGADIVQTGNIFREQNCRDSAASARAADASRRKIFACACGEQTGQTSSILAGCAIVIDVDRFAGDMFVRALVR